MYFIATAFRTAVKSTVKSDTLKHIKLEGRLYHSAPLPLSMHSSPTPRGMGEESRNKEEEMRGENGLHRHGEKSKSTSSRITVGSQSIPGGKGSSEQQKSNVREIWYL